MKTLIFSIFFIINYAYGMDLSVAIKDTLNSKENRIKLIENKESLLKIEYFLQSNEIKNNLKIFETEFINYSLKNPVVKIYTRLPLDEKNFLEYIILIEEKVSNLSPVSAYLGEMILLELRKLRQSPIFKNYLTQIKKSYYFTSKDLKQLDRRMKYIEPWLSFFINSSLKDIDSTTTSHLIQFTSHFQKSAEFMLNKIISIDKAMKLIIFANANDDEVNPPIENKLEKIIKSSERILSKDATEQANLNGIQAIKQWRPKDEESQAITPTLPKNLNINENYPRPSPNYLPPSNFPIPMNDW